MKFSITIPAYKAQFLYEAIDSVLKQTYDDFELIIVDDCSPEDLKSIVGKFSDPRIRYYRNEKNCGAEHVVDNWNISLGYCSGDWVICMGDDDMLMPNCLEEYAKAIQQYPSVDLLHARVRQIDEKGDLIAILPERPQLQSACSFITGRMTGYTQYIGDFCFRTARLRKEGGFFDLPFAWAADDVSAFNCSYPDGVANINVPVFCYRINRFSISNSRNEEKKLRALLGEEVWLKDFVSAQQAKNELEKEELKCLTKAIPNGMQKARYYVLYDNYHFGNLSILRWLFVRRKYNIKFRTVIKVIVFKIIGKFTML